MKRSSKPEGTEEVASEKAPQSGPGVVQSDSELLEELLQRVKEKILSDRTNFSVGDLIRLLEARQELRTDEVREIVVRWVGDSKEESAG
ncbi:MAG: hypothetical protein JNK87_20095 [Bryobacterales bacterium]|nr:hypothetical protein [Bryobacterales bacterium]